MYNPVAELARALLSLSDPLRLLANFTWG